MRELTDKQTAILTRKHSLPEAYRAGINAALREAFQMGRDVDVMHVQHKPTLKKDTK